MNMIPRYFLLLVLVAAPAVSYACQVPVFRYALERWPADNYEMVILHDEPLSPAQAKLVERLRDSNHKSPTSANFQIRKVNALKSQNQRLQKIWEQHGEAGKPILAALFPETADEVPDRLISVEPLTNMLVDRIIQSPLREEITNRLVSGESAVWIFVPIGDQKQDSKALKTLQQIVAENEKSLELPEQEEAEDESELLEQVDIELKLDFSIVTLDKQDPHERFLYQTLMASEPDLKDLKKPMAFPVLGRGRVLYALVGDGISEHTISLASRFIIGPCSCQVKNQNPGFDLLMAADWDERIGKNKLSDPIPETKDEPVYLTIPPGKK